MAPGRDRRLLRLKAVDVAFSLASFLFGVVEEYRIWLELAPLATVAVAGWLLPEPAED